MIPPAVVTSWSLTHSWPTPAQVEQDLLLSRAICEIAADPYLGDELVFRGGTAFHKLHMAPPIVTARTWTTCGQVAAASAT